MYPGTVREQEPAPQPAAEQVAGRVAAECAEPGQGEQGENIDVALAGDHAAQDHDRLPGHDEARERGRLKERHHPDQRVRIRA